MDWWLWVVVGISLLGVEMLTPGGFYTLFFGIGAILTGVAVGTGLVSASWVQWLIFPTLSTVALVLFRGRISNALSSGAAPAVGEGVIGEVATLVEDLPSGGVGRAELRGTTWLVRSRGAVVLLRGQRCRVEGIDGLTLWVRPE